MRNSRWLVPMSTVVLAISIGAGDARGQEKVKLSYSSIDTTNSVYFVAQERGF